MEVDKEARLYEKIDYNIDQAAQCEKTENSDDKRRLLNPVLRQILKIKLITGKKRNRRKPPTLTKE